MRFSLAPPPSPPPRSIIPPESLVSYRFRRSRIDLSPLVAAADKSAFLRGHYVICGGIYNGTARSSRQRVAYVLYPDLSGSCFFRGCFAAAVLSSCFVRLTISRRYLLALSQIALAITYAGWGGVNGS